MMTTNFGAQLVWGAVILLGFIGLGFLIWIGIKCPQSLSPLPPRSPDKVRTALAMVDKSRQRMNKLTDLERQTREQKAREIIRHGHRH